jgi:hypothetical protein
MRILLALLPLAPAPLSVVADSSASSPGEGIYRRGLLPSGRPLRGERASATAVEGPLAACVNCHRRSGLGASEGRILIPPITARYLFGVRARNAGEPGMPGMETPGLERPRFTEATLARAIREGVGSDGRRFDELMPHYALDDSSMAVLIAYLRQLSSDRVPGVSDERIEFATIITPDADPIQRKGMLEVLDTFFANKNVFFREKSPPLQSSHNIHYRIVRKWKLHVWQLAGSPESWEQQLHQRLRAEPVFAVISGLGGKTWAPVHRFCEAESLPCLFPNVDLPVVAEDDFYPVYFSKGVLLEAQLLAGRLAQKARAAGLHHVVQVYRSGDIGAAAAHELRAGLAAQGIEIVDRPLAAAAKSQTLSEAVNNVQASDALILWMRPKDLQALPPSPPPGALVFASGLMGGLERAPLPTNWRASTDVTYPFDLPDDRRLRMDFPLRWFKIRQIEMVDERVQTDTFVACGILAEVLAPMLDNFVRDHLLERLETMLSARTRNGYYPRLGLGPGQRFASKGGYLVHFADVQGPKVVADGEWIVP